MNPIRSFCLFSAAFAFAGHASAQARTPAAPQVDPGAPAGSFLGFGPAIDVDLTGDVKTTTVAGRLTLGGWF